MRRLVPASAALVLFAAPCLAQAPPCTPCAGIVAAGHEQAVEIAALVSAGWPLPQDARFYVLWPEPLDGSVDPAAVLSTARALRASGATPWLRVTLRTSPPLAANLAALDAELRQLAVLAAALERGAHVTLGWEPPSLAGGGAPEAPQWAFLLKRAAVAVNGAVADARVIAGPLPGDEAAVRALYAEGIAAYVDGVALPPAAPDAVLAALAELDPGKPVIFDAGPLPQPAGLALADAARAAVRGAGVSLFRLHADAPLDARAVAPFKVLAAEFRGDLSYDPTASPAAGWAFVRGEDLNLRVIAVAPDPQQSAWTATVPDPGVRRVTRVEFSTGAESGLGGRTVAAGVEVQIRVRPGDAVAVLRLERASAAEVAGEEEIEEKVLVTSERQMPVEEILRRLQAFEDGQNRRLRHYEAQNRTSLRFLAGGAQAIDATFEGSYFVESGGRSDWAWQTFYVGGVKWRSKTIPEIPLIQPEKAAAMPVDILFTSEYRYTLRGSERLEGRDCWIVDFAPAGPVEGKRLYQGTVWVDRETYSRVRSKALQLGLTGDVLSNEETVHYSTVASGGASYVLPLRVVAQQLFSFLNNVTVVEKETTLSDLVINGAEFETRRAAVLASDATMVRDTEKGLRYLVKDETTGERVVKEGFDTNKLFLLGGVFYEESLDYPLPLAGLNYFDADFRRRGEQLNVFFGGVLVSVDYADPSFLGSRWDAGADFFGFAIQTEDSQFRAGEEVPAETVRSRPLSLSLNLGRPLGSYLKVGATYSAEVRDFAATDDTADDFAVPSDHTTHSLALDARYARGGYRLSLSGSENRRSEWQPWGFAGNPEFDPSAESYSLWGASLAKVWHLQNFRKLGAEVDYFDGADLDRFSKYEFGFFGGTRVHGYASNQVRAEQGWAGHLSYGFEVGEALRLEGVVDAALADDVSSGLDGELLAGVGVQGTFVGPWQTIVNLDVGLAVDGPEDGFAVYVVFLKLFK